MNEGVFKATQGAYDWFEGLYHGAIPEDLHNLPLEVAITGFGGEHLL